MKDFDYKQEIANTRKGCLGGSDGNLLSQVASLGYVPKSAYKRLAVAKGLIENDNVTTRVMLYGDFIENEIYAHLSEADSRYESNPLWVSNKYSKKNCKLICHADFVLADEKTKTLKVYECKATRFSPQQTRATYKNQLFIEWTIANEIVKTKGQDWKVQMFLCHYNTEGVNIEDVFAFDPERLSVHKLNVRSYEFDIDKAMSIVNDFEKTFEFYSEDEEIDSEYLPENVKNEFDVITGFLAEIKEREAKVDEFKRRLCDFMQEKGIKAIKNDSWNITLVEATESVSFDGKRYLADLAKAHPRKAKKIKSDYEKRTAKGAYVKITIKTKKDNNN